MKDSYVRRVRRGMKWLDHNHELRTNWVQHIRPTILALEQGELCVLGQLYKGFWHRPTVLTLRGCERMGFWLNVDGDGGGKYDRLTSVWKSELEKRGVI